MDVAKDSALGLLTGARACGPNAVMIRCPFHRHQDGSAERCASMRVNLEAARFFCFSCQQEGDLDDLARAARPVIVVATAR